MSLNKLYLLRILQIDVYLNFLQASINYCENYLTIKDLNNKKSELMEERKQIRKFLNMIELWRLQNV